MAERDDHMDEAAGHEHAFDFGHHEFGALQVFENGITFDALEQAAGKRQLLRVCGDVDARQGKQIEIDITVYGGTGAADVQVPAAERCVNLEYFGISNERLGWPQ